MDQIVIGSNINNNYYDLKYIISEGGENNNIINFIIYFPLEYKPELFNGNNFDSFIKK